MNSLVLRCIGLEHLHVSSVCGRLPLPTVAKHGSTLRSLTLRERDRWRPVATVSSPNLTAEDLDLVDASCPHLESLAVDMERSEQWVRAGRISPCSPSGTKAELRDIAFAESEARLEWLWTAIDLDEDAETNAPETDEATANLTVGIWLPELS